MTAVKHTFHEGQIVTNQNGYDYKVKQVGYNEVLFERVKDGELVLAWSPIMYDNGKIEWSSGKYIGN